MDRFSSRRAQITKTALALADQYGKDRGHAPDERALASMRRFAYAMTRRAKEPGALSFTALLRGWERASHMAELGTLRDPREPYGTRHHAQAPPQERVVTHARRTRTDGSAALPGGHTSRRRCAARMERASTELTEASGTPPARNCLWKSGCSPAQYEGAPYVARDRSAALLGADFGQLQTQLHAGAAGG